MWETDLAFPPISQHLKNAPGPADIFFPKNWIYLKPHSRSSWWLLVVGCLVLQEHHWKPEAIEVPCKSKDRWTGEQMDSWEKGRKGERTVLHLRRRNSGLSDSVQAAPSLGCWSSTWHSHVISCVIIFSNTIVDQYPVTLFQRWLSTTNQQGGHNSPIFFMGDWCRLFIFLFIPLDWGQQSFVQLCGADAILTLLSLLFREITRFHPDPGMEKVKERRSPICHGRAGAVTPPCLLRFGHQKNWPNLQLQGPLIPPSRGYRWDHVVGGWAQKRRRSQGGDGCEGQDWGDCSLHEGVCPWRRGSLLYPSSCFHIDRRIKSV